MPKKTTARSPEFIKSRPGRTTVLTEAEEKILVEWIVTSSRKGFSQMKEDVLVSAEQFLRKEPNCFKNNKSGEGWYRLFLKWHPEITTWTAEAVTAASANMSESNVRKWCAQIDDYLNEQNLKHILADPTRIFKRWNKFPTVPENYKDTSREGDKKCVWNWSCPSQVMSDHNVYLLC